MALSKRELLQGGVSDQQALVKKLQEKRVMPPKRRQIPGGKNLLDNLDQEGLEKAVYNWLRGCRAFSEVTIGFAKEPEKFQYKTQKVRDFGDTGQREIWEIHPEGRLHLAKQLADILTQHKALKVVAKKDGIWLYTDATGEFSPVRVVTEQDVAEQLKLVEEVKEEMKATGEDPDELVYNPLHVGDLIPSEDWEPFIEFIPKAKQEYGR